jgi:hypothetical protein
MKRNTLHSSLALLLAGCALSLPTWVGAEESKNLYKCVDGKGVVSIQSKSCPAGTTQAWMRPAQTEPKQTEQDVQAARERERRDQQQVRELSAELNRKVAEQIAAEQPRSVPGSQIIPTTPTPEAPDPGALQSAVTSQCGQAQSFMAAVREKTWIGMTDEQMKRIYAWVADQCRVNSVSSQQ